MVANSMIVSSGLCVSQVVTPQRGAVIPDVNADTVRWPMSAAALPAAGGDTLIVLCSRIRRGGTGAFGFTFLGTSAAVFDVPRLGVPQLRRVVQITPDTPDPHQINWGAAAVRDGSWLYVYGTRLVPGTAFGRELHVARVPVADPGRRSGWRFWDGQRWRSDVARSAAVLGARGGVSQTLSVSIFDGSWVAVSKRDGDLGDFVYTWTSRAPTGPWTPHRAVRAPAGFDTGELQYAPLAHPEVPLASGRLLVSISRNTTDLRRLQRHPQVGQPKFVEIDIN
jgi:hypothetical protein